MKALIVVSFALVLSCHTAPAAPSESRGLGLLTNYYHDCPARHGPQAEYVRSTIKRALHGDHAAMRSVIMHNGPFSTGDNEGYSEVPQALLRTLGDNRYAAFVSSAMFRTRRWLSFPIRFQHSLANSRRLRDFIMHAFPASHETSNRTMERTAARLRFS